MSMSQQSTTEQFRKLVTDGLQQVKEEHGFLLKLFIGILEETGENNAASLLRDGFSKKSSG